MSIKAVLAVAPLLAALVTGVGVAHALPDSTRCNVGSGGEVVV
jgi:hypothetical protein